MVSWDVVVTGAVGIVGIGGTIMAAWMTTRAQAANLLVSIKAENKRARLAEKRRIYAEFLASTDAMTPLIIKHRLVKREGHSEEERDSNFNELMQAENIMMRTSMEARLIATPTVRHLVVNMTETYLEYAKDTDDGATELVSINLPIPVATVIDAMRADFADDQ